jgi:hypothetical protein
LSKQRPVLGTIGNAQIRARSVAKALVDRDELITGLRAQVETLTAGLAAEKAASSKLIEGMLETTNAYGIAFRRALENAAAHPWIRVGLALRVFPRVLHRADRFQIDLANFQERRADLQPTTPDPGDYYGAEQVPA